MKKVALTAALLASTPAYAGVMCIFNTGQPGAPHPVYNFGWVSGNDYDGLYALFDYGDDQHNKTTPPEGQRPAWIYHIENRHWTFTSVDSVNMTIVFDANARLTNERLDFPAAIKNAGGGQWIGVCEIGGPAS